MITVCPAYLHWGEIKIKFDIDADAKSGGIGKIARNSETGAIEASAILSGPSGRKFSKKLGGSGGIGGSAGGGGGICH